MSKAVAYPYKVHKVRIPCENVSFLVSLCEILAQFDKCFLVHKNSAMRLNALLPAQISDTSFGSLTEELCMYLPVIADDANPDMNDVRTDFIRWQSLWQDVTVR